MSDRPAATSQILDGRPVVILAATNAEHLAAVLFQINAGRTWRGQPPIPALTDLVRELRWVAQLDSLLTSVPRAEQAFAPTPRTPGVWVTTSQAAQALGITERAVRQRISRGTLPAKRVGRDWLVDLQDLGDKAA